MKSKAKVRDSTRNSTIKNCRHPWGRALRFLRQDVNAGSPLVSEVIGVSETSLSQAERIGTPKTCAKYFRLIAEAIKDGRIAAAQLERAEALSAQTAPPPTAGNGQIREMIREELRAALEEFTGPGREKS